MKCSLRVIFLKAFSWPKSIPLDFSGRHVTPLLWAFDNARLNSYQHETDSHLYSNLNAKDIAVLSPHMQLAEI